MSDLEHLEAAVSDIEARFLEVKEMVDLDVDNLIWELDEDFDRLNEAKVRQRRDNRMPFLDLRCACTQKQAFFS
jgi:hypothetical protein